MRSLPRPRTPLFDPSRLPARNASFGIRLLSLVLATVSLALPLAALALDPLAEDEADPAEIAIGERLFLETRFAEFFAREIDRTGDVNAPLGAGDPTVDVTTTTGDPLPGPFVGESMNCSHCHLVDAQLDAPGGGMRTYGDFAARTPIPRRRDGKTLTVRNSPPLVNASLPRLGGVLLHFDAEFTSGQALARSTLTGRNYGWLPGEADAAVRHIARVVREDDGLGDLAQEFGGAYATVLAGVDPGLPDELRLPPAFRIDVATASDDEIVDAVAKLIEAYLDGLVFEQDEQGNFVGSPFDAFLAANGLDAQPAPGESAVDYSRRLRSAIDALVSPVFVDDGSFEFHDHGRVFGSTELAGLRVFLRESGDGAGNCLSCHPAPVFSDFDFHNTGVSQDEYDDVHGEGRFAGAFIPGLSLRRRLGRIFLPATETHPLNREKARSIPSRRDPLRMDLGLWNVFANPDFPDSQPPLEALLCTRVVEQAGPAPKKRRSRRRRPVDPCSDAALLPHTIALFKTPSIRDTGHGAPYMHNGRLATVEDVLRFYRESARLAREGRLRNAAPELRAISLTDDDIVPLAAFLRSLDEDYE